MKNILLIFALSICSCSQEDTSPKPCTCDVMVLSDALPVQFWLNECETYNEHEPEGVHYVCWCQPWNCDDEVHIQFQDTPGGTYILQIVSEEGDPIDTVQFDEVDSGVYYLSFVPSALESNVCQQKVSLRIVDASDISIQVLSNPGFTGSLSPWTNEGDGQSFIYSGSNEAELPEDVQEETQFLLDEFTGDYLNGSGASCSLTADVGTGESWTTAGSCYRTVTLPTGPGPFSSDILYTTFSPLRGFTGEVGEISSALVGGADDPGVLTVRILDAGDNVINTYNFNLTSTPTKYSFFYNGADEIVKIELFVTVDNSGAPGPTTVVSFAEDTGLLVYSMEDWFNTGSGNEPPSTSGSTSNWQPSLDHSGSLKVTTVNTFGPKNLRLSDATLPQQQFKVRIKYLIETGASTNITLRFIVRDAAINQLYNNQFGSETGLGVEQTAELTISDPDVWLNVDHFLIDASSTNWVAGDNIYITEFEILALEPAITKSKRLTQTFTTRLPGKYIAQISLNTATAPDTRVRVVVNNSGSNEQVLIDETFIAFMGTASYEFDGDIDNAFNTLYVLLGDDADPDPVGNIFVDYVNLYEANAVTAAKSDCLDVQEDHDETILITYSNNRNFDGLIYENQSPDISFNIRVPARFYHEREPEEDNAMELTSSVITTSSEVKTQRLLEVKHGPYYWHKKLRRVLKHQNLTIYDKAWKKEEAYEVIEGKKTWPLKSATCYLTEKNSVVRNVL